MIPRFCTFTLVLRFFDFLYKIVYFFIEVFIASFSQGGAVVPFPSIFPLSAPFLCRLPALPMVVCGSGRVYACDWGVVGNEVVVLDLLCLPK